MRNGPGSMELIFPSYLVPAVGLSIGIWMVVSLLRSLGVKAGPTKAIFIVVATVFLAPVLIPSEIIAMKFVPSGMFLLLGAYPFGSDGITLLGVASLLGTTVVAWTVAQAIWRVGKS